MAIRGMTRPGIDYRILCGSYGLAFGLIRTLFPLYLIRTLGFDPFQQVILGTIFEISITLFEIPTGIVADLKSRKLSVVVGHFMTGTAFLIAGFVGTFALMAVSAVIWGIGETFISGAREAWVADELAAQNSDETPERVFIRGNQWLLAGRFVGTWVSVGLAVISLSLPCIAGGVILVLSGFYTLKLTESGFHRQAELKHGLSQMVATFKKGWLFTLGSAVLIAIVLTNFLIGFTSEGFDRLWQQVIEDQVSLPLITIPGMGTFDEFWFALFNTGAMVLTAILLGLITRARLMSNITSIRRTLLIMTIAIVVGLVIFGLSNSLMWAMIGFLLVRTTRRAFDPLLVAWLNQNALPEIRATLLSFSGQMHSIGEILGGPLIGAVALRVSTSAGMLLSAGMLAPGVPLLFAKMRKADPNYAPRGTSNSAEMDLGE